jgi:hypothetical protein
MFKPIDIREVAPNKGRRTVVSLAKALIPTRHSIVLSVFCLMAVAGLWVGAHACSYVGLEWLSGQMRDMIPSFKMLPFWVIVIHSMSQFGSKTLEAYDNTRYRWREVYGPVHRETWDQDGETISVEIYPGGVVVRRGKRLAFSLTPNANQMFWNDVKAKRLVFREDSGFLYGS